MGQSLDVMATDRRRFLAVCSAAGLAGGLFPGALLTLSAAAAEAQTARGAPKASATAAPTPSAVEGAEKNPGSPLAKITPTMIDAAAVIAGLTISDEQKQVMLEGLTSQRDDVLAVRELELPNSVAPSFVFDPVPAGMELDPVRKPIKLSAPTVSKLHLAPETKADDIAANEALAFMSVRELAELVRTRQVNSTYLTKMYLARLKHFDPQLHFVITLTEERALKQAAEADRLIAAGKYLGPLHGIPWGGKDLLAVKGYPTTWGAAGFEGQMFEDDAEVVTRLDRAGAVLVAKLSLGALAQGDLWGYPAGSGKAGARTRNPWNTRQGSSGSSAGSASSVAAGCVGFAIGTETLGSISSPSTRCGVSGLRPSYGLVPKTGAMALSWTMDKIGPICRAVEDCCLVLSSIYGPDGHDLSVKPAAFNWDAGLDWKKLRVGYLKASFDVPTLPELKAPTAAGDKEMEAYRKRVAGQQAQLTRAIYDRKYALAALDVLRQKMGVTLIEKTMPTFPFGALVPVLEAEGAAAFDTLTRSGRDKLLAGQQPFDWPNNFRVARFYSAVDYIQAMRARTLAIGLMTTLFADVDVIVTPSQGAQLVATNLTGQPAVIVPNGLRGDDAPPSPDNGDGALENSGGPGTPTSLTFLGGLYTDARLAAFARAYQEATGFHKVHPKLV